MSDGFELRNGLPVKIESWAALELKARWMIVSAEDYRPIEGHIISANAETGDATLSVRVPGADEPKIETIAKGFNGIRIVPRGK